MDEVEKYSLPFLTRPMLEFEHGTIFELEIESMASEPITIVVSGITREGPFSLNFTHDGMPDQYSSPQRVSDIPIFLTVHGANTNTQRGECFVRIFLRMNSNRVMTMCQGYIDGLTSLGWPAIQSESELSGHGKLKVITGTNPAAGAEISQTVPFSRAWKIKAINFGLTTDATAVTRLVRLIVTDGTNTIYVLAFSKTQTASATQSYYATEVGTIQTATAGGKGFAGLPLDLILPEGYKILTGTGSLQAGDDFTAPILTVEEFLAI